MEWVASVRARLGDADFTARYRFEKGALVRIALVHVNLSDDPADAHLLGKTCVLTARAACPGSLLEGAVEEDGDVWAAAHRVLVHCAQILPSPTEFVDSIIACHFYEGGLALALHCVGIRGGPHTSLTPIVNIASPEVAGWLAHSVCPLMMQTKAFSFDRALLS